jgi:hypothetical protein
MQKYNHVEITEEKACNEIGGNKTCTVFDKVNETCKKGTCSFYNREGKCEKCIVLDEKTSNAVVNTCDALIAMLSLIILIVILKLLFNL